jgi:hypothetical protein
MKSFTYMQLHKDTHINLLIAVSRISLKKSTKSDKIYSKYVNLWMIVYISLKSFIILLRRYYHEKEADEIIKSLCGYVYCGY